VAIGGPAVTATIARPGQVARFTFTGPWPEAPGGRHRVDAPGAVRRPDLRDPVGTVVDQGCVAADGTGDPIDLTAASGGTYTVEVNRPTWAPARSPSGWKRCADTDGGAPRGRRHPFLTEHPPLQYDAHQPPATTMTFFGSRPSSTAAISASAAARTTSSPASAATSTRPRTCH